MARGLTLNSFGCSVYENIFTCFSVLGKGLNNAYSFVIYAVSRLASKDTFSECPSGPVWSINLQYICYRLLLSFFIHSWYAFPLKFHLHWEYVLLIILIFIFVVQSSFALNLLCWGEVPRKYLMDLQKLPLRFTQDWKMDQKLVQNILFYIWKRKMLLPFLSWFTERSLCFIVGKCLHCETGN